MLKKSMPRHFYLSALLLAILSSIATTDAEQVVFNEIMYHPPAGGYEFVEVENLTSTPFDIASWRLSGGVDYQFPAFNSGAASQSFLKAFERIVICETDPATFRNAYGLPAAIRVFGPWSGNLDNAGERITLKDKNNVPDAEPVDQVFTREQKLTNIEKYLKCVPGIRTETLWRIIYGK